MATLALTLLVVLVLAQPEAARATSNLLGNSTFDTGIEGWTLFTERGAEMSWDSTNGSPVPGSLRISGSDGTSGFLVGEALSECFDAPPGGRLQLTGRARAENIGGEARCLPYFVRYAEPGCGGSRTFLGGVVDPDEPGVWFDTSAVLESPPSGTSFRVSLAALVVVGEGPIACNFDSLALFEAGVEVEPVPSLSGPGLLLFLVSLIAAAFWVLRRTA